MDHLCMNASNFYVNNHMKKKNTIKTFRFSQQQNERIIKDINTS